MSGDNTPPNPPVPSIRAAATALLQVLGDLRQRCGAAQQDNLRAALDAPMASRPVRVPEVGRALATIAAMKAGEPIAPGGIQAVVELAEEGARQLDQFAARFDADRRAMAAWADAHPDLSAWVPERDDALVWLMSLFDCSFDRPTVDQADQVRARLGAAQLRMPNALTKDSRDMIAQLIEALRKTSRRAFLAEERVRQIEAGGESVLTDHLDAMGLLGEAAASIRDAASAYADQDNGGGYREASALARRIEAFLAPPDALAAFDPDGGQTFSAADHRADLRRPDGPASDRAFDALIEAAREGGVIKDGTIWREPGEAARLLATKLAQLTGYPIRDRAGPSPRDEA